MRIRFRWVKDVAIHPMDWLIGASALMPGPLRRGCFGGIGWLAKTYYFLPYNHARRTLSSFCSLTGRPNPRRTYFDLVDGLVFATMGFGQLRAHGAETVAQRVTFDEATSARLEAVRAKYGSGILVVPHCAASALSAAGFSRRFPSVLLVRESRSASRSRLMRRYFDRLGADLLFVRRAPPMEVARGILKALSQKKFVIGTTDLARPGPDTVEVNFFGERVPLPAWPARFSLRRKVPILPGYIRVEGDRLALISHEPFLAEDLASATQRWASCFEQSIRESPADWSFMLDKRWSRVIARAAEAQRQSLTLRPAVD